jgi:hypothetical protein
VYYTHGERPREAQSDQQFWYHTKCLTDTLHPSAKMYVLEFLTCYETEQFTKTQRAAPTGNKAGGHPLGQWKPGPTGRFLIWA